MHLTGIILTYRMSNF